MPRIQAFVVGFEYVLIAFVSLIFAIFLMDLLQAWNAQPCSPNATPNCYPWGGREGPIEGAWNYTSKKTYLVSSIHTQAILGITLLGSLLIPSGRRIFLFVAVYGYMYFSDSLLEQAFSK